jgi:hypothetical protein
MAVTAAIIARTATVTGNSKFHFILRLDSANLSGSSVLHSFV